MASASNPSRSQIRIAIIGVGLIGGSIGLAVRGRLGAEAVGFDPDAGNLARALEIGAIDRAATSVADAIKGDGDSADVIFCAAPVAALPDLVTEAIGASSELSVVTDVGSTKWALVEALADLEDSDRFIGGHPLAGAETAGVDGSRDDLFEGARWYLTPTARSQGVLFDRLHGVLAGIGARPQAINAAIHDREMAAISHLPHVLANALVSTAAQSVGADSDRPAEVGRSFRDATRVAGANPAIWADIYSSNSEAIADEIDSVVARLQEASALVRGGGRDQLSDWQQAAREDRRTMLESDLAASPLLELRIAVENRPGTVAEIALALGHAGVNIEDMSLFPAADQRTGAISLWIAGSGDASRAAEIVADLGHTVAPILELEA